MFKINDFISIRAQRLTRLNEMFLYQLSRGQIKLFARVTMIENFRNPRVDSILGASYLKLSTLIDVIRLSNIESKKYYMLYIKRIK